MKQRLKDIFKGPVAFYPVLLAAFPVLFLYAYNINETSVSQIWLPMLVSVAATLALWAMLSLSLRSLPKAALATAAFLVFFFAYGRLYDVLVNWGLFVPEHAYLLPTMLFVWGYCVYFIGRTKRDFRLTTRLLNVVAVALIAINLFNVASYQVRLAGASADTPAKSVPKAAANTTELTNLPDIYFIIMDEYAHPDTMLEWYDYDNSQFVNRLEDEGFYIGRGSKTRSPSTPQCLAQILNMEYLTPGWDWSPEIANYVERGSGAEYSKAYVWNDATFKKIAYNEVVDFLRAHGYEYIVFGPSSPWENYIKQNSDLYFNYSEDAATPWISAFQETLWQTTMLKPFYYRTVGCEYESSYRRMTLHTLEHLQEMPEMEVPKLIFAHLICPHEPFVFGPDGEYTSPQSYQDYGDKEAYLGQYIFISREIEKVVDTLLEESEIPPIIILQSDHGLRAGHEGLVIGDDEWHKIMNAMYLPGMDYTELSDSMSPVNTFRLIFDYYFGADYPLLEND
jgi:hypothetical protein